MADSTFNVAAGKKMKRESVIAHLNVGTNDTPDWGIMGKGVQSSDMELDWGRESNTDITGETETDMKTPIITQAFDPWPYRGGDKVQEKLWTLAIEQQDAAALVNLDCLIVHSHVGSETEGYFAERYEGCAFEQTRYGGDGGAFLTAGFTVTYGGKRTVGTAKSTGGKITFTPKI